MTRNLTQSRGIYRTIYKSLGTGIPSFPVTIPLDFGYDFELVSLKFLFSTSIIVANRSVQLWYRLDPNFILIATADQFQAASQNKYYLFQTEIPLYRSPDRAYNFLPIPHRLKMQHGFTNYIYITALALQTGDQFSDIEALLNPYFIYS